MKELLPVLKALGDENRLRIFLMLKERPLCVCEIDEVLDIALSTLSQHLKTMKSAGIITDRKEGRWVFYSLNAERDLVKTVMDFLDREIGIDERVLRDRKRISELSREICCSTARRDKGR